jgi:CorA-like Mg2+ transporter protein
MNARASLRFLSMASANSFITDWDAKFTYNFWRPVTAIRNGDQDGNDATDRDATWTPLVPTPMHPEYPSQAAVSAGVMMGISSQGDSEAGVIASSVYAGGRRVKDIAIEEAGEWSKRPRHVVWIGLFEPSADVLQRVQAQLGLHYLAIEDAGNAHEHPKVEQYGNAVFVARTAQLIDGRIAFGETHLFVGRGYVVSVRHGASRSYAPVRERCECSTCFPASAFSWQGSGRAY